MTYSVSAEEGQDSSLITDPKSTSGILPNELNTSIFVYLKLRNSNIIPSHHNLL